MKIQDLTVSKEMDMSEMTTVRGGASDAPDPISYLLNLGAEQKGAYGVISAASQIEPSQGGSNPKGVCLL